MYVFMYECICTYMCMNIYIYICIYIYIYIPTSPLGDRWSHPSPADGCEWR